MGGKDTRGLVGVSKHPGPPWTNNHLIHPRTKPLLGFLRTSGGMTTTKMGAPSEEQQVIQHHGGGGRCSVGGGDDVGGGFVRVGAASDLQRSARHLVTLREQIGGVYHSLLLYHFPSISDPASSSTSAASTSASSSLPSSSSTPSSLRRWYCMESSCPHLGAPLESAPLEELLDEETGEIEDLVTVCPFHSYDFSLSTGESSTGMRACVYAVEERNAVSEDGSSPSEVWIEAPSVEQRRAELARWEVVEVRPVSEASAAASASSHSADSALAQATAHQLQLSEGAPRSFADPSGSASTAAAIAAVAAPAQEPKTLVGWAVLVLNTSDPARKVAYTRMAAHAFRSGRTKVIGGGRWARGESEQEHGGPPREESGGGRWMREPNETPPLQPPRREGTTVVDRRSTSRSGRAGSEKGRIVLLHALANIEQWAIDLAWDMIARAPELHARLVAPRGAEGDGVRRTSSRLPLQFYSDFVKVAEDEAKHYSLLAARLEEMGSYFGALSVHHGLWESAMDTSGSILARLSIIHLVHEARGLDVNPTTIKKFAAAKDDRSVDVLTTIHLDEVTHVTAGHRWLTHLCAHADPPLDPIQVFREQVRLNFDGKLKGPFNTPDRERAGLSKAWYEDLQGARSERKGDERTIVGVQRSEVAGG